MWETIWETEAILGGKGESSWEIEE